VSGGIRSGKNHTAPIPDELLQLSFSAMTVTAPEFGPMPMSA
jgi:hypothetical protein